jgi:hypothetical protein
MKTIFVLIPLATLLFVPAAWAQCATGVDTGGQCIPPDALEPQVNSNQPRNQQQQPRAVWADSWGAIAIDGNTGQAGMVANRTSKAEAAATAIHDCAMHGSANCKLEITYYNQCAAVAWGTGRHSVVRDPTETQAQSHALSECSQGAQDCKIVYSGCSVPVRVR